MPFRGVLTILDAPSDRPPAGARGHRVVLTRAAAETALPSLIGMAVDFTAGFDGHDARRKVGIITSAEITSGNVVLSEPALAGESKNPFPHINATKEIPRLRRAQLACARNDNSQTVIQVAGYIFARDFPEVVRELHTARDLGMSYEVADAAVEDIRAPVWKLTAVTFTGAAILRRKKAAYEQTSISLAASSKPRSLDFEPAGSPLGMTNQDNQRGLGVRAHTGEIMNTELTKQFLEMSDRLAAAAQALESTLARLDAQHTDISTKIDRMVAAVDDTAERKTLEDRVSDLLSKKEELEKQNAELKAQAARATSSANQRKTLSPMVSALLAKNGLEGDKFEVSALDKILAPLSVEQRIAVKGEMARAGVIS
jgi:hypothetical protein